MKQTYRKLYFVLFNIFFDQPDEDLGSLQQVVDSNAGQNEDQHRDPEADSRLHILRVHDLELERLDTPPLVVVVPALKSEEEELVVLIHEVGLANNIIAREPDCVGATEAARVLRVALDVHGVDKAEVAELEVVVNSPVVPHVPVESQLNDKHLARLDVNDGL